MSPLLAFLIAAVVLAITPGPGIAYVVACTVAGGRKEGLASSLGAAVGGMMHVLAAALGVSLLIAQSALAFSIVKYLGAAYLVYLGIRLLLAKNQVQHAIKVTAKGSRRAFRDGIIVEALNVKTAIFFLAFLPQFTLPSQPLIPQLVALGTICVFLNTAVDIIAVFVADRLLKSEAARNTRARILTQTSGITMLGLGAYLAFARREA
jgi:threonine/homoserine/homoserine lactone efflux protein